MKWLKKLLGASKLAMTHEVTDDSGFLATIDPDAYSGFVQKDWTLELLFAHFLREIAAGHLLLWGTGVGNTWKIHASSEPTGVTGFREVIGSINATRGRLLLTNYESLAMAAAHADVRLPQEHEQDQVLEVAPGLYDCRIVQLSDPDSSAPFKEPVNFVYELQRVTQHREPWKQIPWKAF